MKETKAHDDADQERGMTMPSVEHVPPKSLVLIWILMASELGFDLVTTVIAFAATIGDQYCCGYTIHLGPLPLSSTIPFFLLILAELSFLGRAILLTLWPSFFGIQNENGDKSIHDNKEEGFEVELSKAEKGTDDDEEETVAFERKGSSSSTSSSLDKKAGSVKSTTSSRDEASSQKKKQLHDEKPHYVEKDEGASSSQKRSCFIRLCCCCLRWNARMVLNALNMLTLLNPFFGCLIAWMLLYQSDKTEAFVVLGLEGFSIILHFVAVRLEGGLRTWRSKLLHSVTILPFLVSVIMMLIYLREGGVCYVVESQLFLFSGCEVCPDTGTPPDEDGMCGDVALTGAGGVVGDIYNFDITDLGSLTDRGALQETYCSEKVNFCFYSF